MRATKRRQKAQPEQEETNVIITHAMSTRTVISAKRARETLVRLLFSNSNTESLDRRLSYSALKEAYLEKVQELHPDKNRHRNDERNEYHEPACKSDRSRQTEFIELKNAWEEYDKIAKLNKLTTHAPATHAEEGTDEASFTLFGVGCSFADSPTERDYRNEIMEQASRGWFSSGELATGVLEPRQENATRTTLHTLSIPEKNSNTAKVEVDEKAMYGNSEELLSNRRKSLVQDLDKFKRK